MYWVGMLKNSRSTLEKFRLLSQEIATFSCQPAFAGTVATVPAQAAASDLDGVRRAS